MNFADVSRQVSQSLHATFSPGIITLRRKADPSAAAKTVPAVFGGLNAEEAALRMLEAGSVTLSVAMLDLDGYRLDGATTIAFTADADAVQYAFIPLSGPLTASTSDALSGAMASVSGSIGVGG